MKDCFCDSTSHIGADLLQDHLFVKTDITNLFSPPALQNEPIINRATGRCLEVVPANVYFGYLLVLQPCSGQRWTIRNAMKQ